MRFLEDSEVVSLLPQERVPYSEVKVGDIIVEGEDRLAFMVAKIIEDDCDQLVFLDIHDNYGKCTKKKNADTWKVSRVITDHLDQESLKYLREKDW